MTRDFHGGQPLVTVVDCCLNYILLYVGGYKIFFLFLACYELIKTLTILGSAPLQLTLR